MSRLVTILIVFACVLFANPISSFATQPLSVFVSIAPQKFFVKKIGKDLVDVTVMVAAGDSPAAYEPKPRQMAALSNAILYFAIGVPFEAAWLDRIASANDRMQLIQTQKGIKKISMKSHAFEEAGGDSHHHDDSGNFDPHVWTSPPLVKIIAKNIANALQSADPKNAEAFEKNYLAFCSELDQLDYDLKKLFREKSGLPFMVFHPSWGYFARTYGLRQIPVEIEGKNPKPSMLADLIRYAKKQDIKVVFVQPQFSSKAARIIANEIGGQVLYADPLAENWDENIRGLARTFSKSIPQ